MNHDSLPGQSARRKLPSPLSPLPDELKTFPNSPQTWRWNYLATLNVPWIRHAQYFCSLEEATDPATIQVHPHIANKDRLTRVQQMGQLMPLLRQRLLARSRNTLTGDLFAPGSPRLAAARTAVETWSKLQLALLRGYYAADGKQIDAAAVDEAYFMFVTGELRIPVVGRRGLGEADSAYYFAFAEFALLARELGVEADVWGRLVPTFVWTLGVYADMQRPVGRKPHAFHRYGPRGRERVFSKAMAVDAKSKAARAKDPAGFEALLTQHCREAFGDLSR